MPVPNDGQVIASTWDDYVKNDPEDQLFNNFWLLSRMKEGNGFRKGAGTPITGTIEYAMNTTVASIDEMETFDPQRVDVFDRYEYTWKLVKGLIVMSEYEREVTKGSAGKFDLEAAKIENLNNSMKYQKTAMLYGDGSGNGGKDPHGLQLLVPDDPTTGTVGAINAGTFTFWRSQQVSGAKSSTAFDNLKAAWRSAYNLASSGPGINSVEFITTDRTGFEGFESLSVTIERLNRTSSSDKLVTGFKGDHVMFKDIPVAYETQHPAGRAYFLNTTNLFIRYMLWMKAFPPMSPVNQFADVVKVLSIFQMCSDNRRRLAVVTGQT